MKKRFTTIMALVIVLAMGMTMVAGAAYDPEKDCEITVKMFYGTTPLKNLEMTIYKVASTRVENNNLYFDPLSAFMAEDDVFDFNGLSAEKNEEYSKKLNMNIINMGRDKIDELKEDGLVISKETGSEGEEAGIVTFSGLDQGVYLIRQTGRLWRYYPIDPILVFVPYTPMEDATDWEYAYELDMEPKIERKIQEETNTRSTAPTTEPTFDIPDTSVPSGSTEDIDVEDTEIPKEELPETGMKQWPVPIMAMSGMLLFGMGYANEKKNKN